MGAAIPLILGGMSAAGGIIQNAQNAGQVKQQEDFQERMRSTQYQTAVADMKAAGLNPALAYQQGGAGTPSGAQATMDNVISPAVSTAADAAAKLATTENTKANTNQLNIESAERLKNLEQDTNIKMAQAPKTEAENSILRESWQALVKKATADAMTAAENTREVRAAATLKEKQIPGAQAQEASDKTIWGKYVRPYINDAKSAKHIID